MTGLPRVTCPQCGQTTTIKEEFRKFGPPQELDVAICIPCGALNVFVGKKWEVRVPTVEELDRELKDPRTQQLIRYAAQERKLNAEGIGYDND